MPTTNLGLPLLSIDGERVPSVKFNEAMEILDARFGTQSSLYTSLVAFWRLTEATGTRSDSWGANHLTDNNTVTSDAGKIGNAAQFTAANSESLSIADNAALSMGDIDFSLAGWVYLDSLGVGRGVVGKWVSSGQYEYLIYLTSGNQLRFHVTADGTTGTETSITNTSVTLTTATWYFVTAWHDATANTVNLKVNNGTTASAAHTTGVFNGPAIFSLGAAAGEYLNGRLDAWGVWKKVLSAAEITTLYNGGAGLETPF